jgi:hypothetical protein
MVRFISAPKLIACCMILCRVWNNGAISNGDTNGLDGRASFEATAAIAAAGDRGNHPRDAMISDTDNSTMRMNTSAEYSMSSGTTDAFEASALTKTTALSSAPGVEIHIVNSRSFLSQYKEFIDLACPDIPPFGTLSQCYVRCSDANCSNAISSCRNSPSLNPYCTTLVRSDTNGTASLQGQLVRLVSTRIDQSEAFRQHQKSCLALGKAKLQNQDDPDVISFIQNQKLKRSVADKLANGTGTILFLHFRKNSGSTMCLLAQAQGLVVPGKVSLVASVGSTSGKNCNPGLHQMSGWWGNKKQQLEWIAKERIQYYGQTVHLPRPDDIPWESFVMATVLRHPISRLYSMFKEGFIVSPIKPAQATKPPAYHLPIQSSTNSGRVRNSSHRRLWGLGDWFGFNAPVPKSRQANRNKRKKTPSTTNIQSDSKDGNGKKSKSSSVLGKSGMQQSVSDSAMGTKKLSEAAGRRLPLDISTQARTEFVSFQNYLIHRYDASAFHLCFDFWHKH